MVETTTLYDDALGILTWNGDLEWWEGQVELLPGQTVSLSIGVEDPDAAAEPTAELQQARRVLLRVRDQEPEARQLAADELLDIYNEEWNDDEPITEDEFIARLVLEDVSIASDGSAEMFYKDNGLFAGHTVLVTLDAAGNLDDADIAG